MNPIRFDRFSLPHYLQRIGRERVTAMLMPFAPELLAHGILMPALALPDEVFFTVLATLPRQQAHLSPALLEVMTAIEVIEERFPDEGPAAPGPLVVTELRLRLGERARPVLIASGGQHGTMEFEMMAAAVKEEGRMQNEESAARCEAHGRAQRPEVAVGSAGGVLADGHRSQTAKGKARFKFTRKGSVYVVRYDGMPKFHMAVNLGPRYIEHWLYHPNAPISSFDLERVVRPEKALVRAKDSIQGHQDAEAVRAYLRQLDLLRQQREEAAEDGNLARADQLDEDIAAIEAALRSPGKAADAGERARVNVNKAVTAVLRRLRKGGPAEQAFGRHLEQFLSLGYECCYHQPPGIIWE
jgi:hypothetical protein